MELWLTDCFLLVLFWSIRACTRAQGLMVFPGVAWNCASANAALADPDYMVVRFERLAGVPHKP